MSTFNGLVWNDKNANGVQDSGELGLPGILLQITDGRSNGPVYASGHTDANGNYSIDLPPSFDAVVVALFCRYSFEQVLVSGAQGNLVIPGGGTWTNNFGLQQVTCTYVASRWVVKVCWIPGQGVRVTYKHRHGEVVTVLYPGTIEADYEQFIAAPSKGHWAALYYRHRPYQLMPPSP